MTISIVIVNYRTPDLVLQCLQALAGEHDRDNRIRVLVGDADSGDGSHERISGFIWDRNLTWATCFPIGCNRGFAYGNNFIVRTHILPDPTVRYVHFLNPDTYVHPGAVAALVDFLEATPQAGVAGSRLEDPDGTPRAFAFRFPSPWREFFRGAGFSLFDRLIPSSVIQIGGLEQATRVDWVTGASFMMPRAVLDQVGLMDDRYFLYFEETDLMARVQDAGFEVWHVPESRVVHLAGQSTGHRSGDNRPRRLSPHWLESRARFLHARHGRIGLVTGTLLFLAGNLFYRLRCLLLLRKINSPPGLWHDYRRYGFTPPSSGASSD